MRTLKCFAILVLGFSCALAVPIKAQQLDTAIFSEAKVLLQDARKVEANLYSPRYYERGFELFSKAKEDFEKGKKLSDIRKKLEEATRNLKKAIEVTRISQITLQEMANARRDALKQDVEEWAPDLFQKGEEIFRKAAMKVEDGKTNDARELAVKGAQIYRQAELEAIKTRILHEVWDALAECREKKIDKLAPITLQKARDLALEAEKILDNDRYAQDKAQRIANEALYEAKHALYLGGVIRKVQKGETDLEEFLLDVEKQMIKIGETLNLSLEFDGGFQPPALRIVEAILELKQENRMNQEQIARLQNRVKELSAEVDSLVLNKLPELKGRLSELERKFREEQEARERFRRVEELFSPEEAKILKEGDNVIIRLYGIQFPSGRAIIRPEYFPLLTKVIQAIQQFPNAYVRIEGHTDSRGSRAVNERLSTERANAVVQYILANSNLDRKRITAVGYGEDRPIASNETEEGRALNRRIEVVIIPVK
jgi:outer membrane protein OmpA-like peptidoglycan-associated protein